jgi:hypothetical protein
LEAGYQFNKDRELGYTQYFNTNVYDPSGKNRGLSPYLQQGFLRYTMKNLWQNDAKDFSISYEPRIYLPTWSSDASKGMILFFRNDITFSKKFTSLFSLNVVEIPIFFAHSTRGIQTENVASANPIFENRVYIIPTFNFTPNLTLSLPIMFHVTRHMNYKPWAKNNDGWASFLWVWPELDYQITPKTTIGAAFYNENSMVASNFTGGLTLTGTEADGTSQGLSSSIVQLVLRQSL